MANKNETVIRTISTEVTKVENVTAVVECQYQSVQKNKQKGFETNIDELLKKIQPAKSFLYRHHAKKNKTERVTTSYVPMNVGQKKKKLFRLSYDYPSFDLSKFRFSKTDNFNDRGYYQVKNEADDKEQHKPYASVQDIYEDHLYEDLNYNEVKNQRSSSITNVNAKFSIVKLQGIFNTIRKPFYKKEDKPVEENNIQEKSIEQKQLNDKLFEEKQFKVKPFEVKEKEIEVAKETSIYENDDSANSLYDTVKVRHTCNCNKDNGQPQAIVEEYLEPIIHRQKESDYCDVNERKRDETFLGYLLSIFGMRRETNDTQASEDFDVTPSQPVTKWTDEKTVMADGSKMVDRSKMADRPLPVPVDKEPYYMHVDRKQAEELLMGQSDGAFILRPSSQPSHVYTLSVACSNAVHNVGVRRRPDGKLALGFARKGERCFTTIPSLLSHHRRRRLLLVSGGQVLGAVTLTEPPLYYHTPSNIPVNKNSGVCLAGKLCGDTAIKT